MVCARITNHLLPRWQTWPVIGIFNRSSEIEKWVSELHEEYADSTVSTIFALFSTVMNAAARARMIPANPCQGIRVTSGEFDVSSWSRPLITPVFVSESATAPLIGLVVLLPGPSGAKPPAE